MNLSRRSFFQGLIAAPAIIKTPGLLMSIKPVRIITLDEYYRLILQPAMEGLVKAEAKLYEDAILYGVGGMEINFEGVLPVYTSIPASTWRMRNSGGSSK